ncbi:MAG: hypothetical protein RJQ14_20460 [Marinoscillum sp.]
MDDIQFWLYLVFGAIYFLARFLKKKKPENSPSRPGQDTSSGQGETRKPVTFEELLKEFTEGRDEKEEEEIEKPEPVEARQLVKERKWQEENKPEEFEEGVTRRFSDDESKRIYQESIQRAEGSKIEFKRDEHFKSKLQRIEDEGEGNDIAAEIKEMLQDRTQAQKAVVLSEILNRKY